jgi:NAD(P) transhydrogenase subunit beta
MIVDGRDAAIDLSYLVATVLFVVGLKLLSSPATARRGNQIAAGGMALAIIATLFTPGLRNIPLMLIAIAVGAVASVLAAQRVLMTQMPQMVAIFNGMGGATAALVSVVEFEHKIGIGRGETTSIVLGTIIGSISFTGSLVAFAKLQELISGRPILLPGRQVVNSILALAVLALTVAVVVLGGGATAQALLIVLFLVSLLLGVLVVVPIGGADMPVVIAILNSLTGVAAALTGFVLSNQAMVVAGILVGASGSLLTLLMARAMNRSVGNVLFGAFGAGPAGGGAAAAGGAALPVKSMSVEDAAIPLAYAERVVIVPGYGLAVAQAQHAVRELADLLEDRGVDVRYAIHPVAGRMPGHMNVLLAEANVPYDNLYEMDDINGEFPKTDVALVVGANDVTNPAARTDPGSPIYGMPILNVDQARQVIVLKRSMKSGFAGIENELFHQENTSMLFGDAKTSLTQLVSAVKAA